jgi:hypothetical protein
MAEPSHPPTLPSTSDTTPYAPVSWLAVAGMMFTGVFVILLLFAGYSAFREKRPLLQPWLLALPVGAIIFSFAARRVIRNSEGTRTGELFGIDLPNSAWWVSLVLLLGYGAYLLAIDYAIRRDARTEVERWVALVIDDKLPQAFNRTLPPGGRLDEGRLLARHRDELLIFRQSDLVRIAVRNKGTTTFTPGGMRDWQYRSTGIECVFTGTLKCPEGMFPAHVQLKGTEGVAGAEGAGAGRQWQVVPGSSGYIQWAGATRTRYGHYVTELEQRGTNFGNGFIRVLLDRPGAQYLAYKGYVEPDGDPATCFRMYDTQHARAATLGAMAGVFGPPDDKQKEYVTKIRNQVFRLPGGAPPDEKQKDQFQQIWDRGGILPPGLRLRNSSDTTPLINVTDTAVEVRVPIELMIPGDELSAARGRLVVACTDKPVMDELKQLRAAADPDKPSDKPDEFRDRTTNWRVVAIESDLVKVQSQRGQPNPGAMEMP